MNIIKPSYLDLYFARQLFDKGHLNAYVVQDKNARSYFRKRLRKAGYDVRHDFEKGVVLTDATLIQVKGSVTNDFFTQHITTTQELKSHDFPK